MGGKLIAWFGGVVCFFLVLGIAMIPLEEEPDVPHDSGVVAVSAPTPEVLSASNEEPESIPQVSPPIPTPAPTQASSLESAVTSAPGGPSTAELEPEPSVSVSREQADYVLNINSGKFHIPSCASVGLMNESNKRLFAGARDDVIEQGFEPCQNCSP